MFLYFSSFVLNALLSNGLLTFFVLIGYLSKSDFGLVGLFSKPPPQLGHTLNNTFSTQWLQNVHSKVQIIASLLPLGNNVEQFSQVGLISSIINMSYTIINRESKY
jgi:hypothetical protein